MHKEVLLYAMRHKLCWLYAFFEFYSPNIISYQKLFSDNYYILTQGLSINKFLVKNFFMNFLSKKFSIMFWTKRCFTQIFFDQKVLIDQENCCDRFKYLGLIIYFLFMIQYDTKIGFGNFVSNHVLKWCLIYENLSQMIECRNQPKHLFQKFH